MSEIVWGYDDMCGCVCAKIWQIGDGGYNKAMCCARVIASTGDAPSIGGQGEVTLVVQVHVHLLVSSRWSWKEQSVGLSASKHTARLCTCLSPKKHMPPDSHIQVREGTLGIVDIQPTRPTRPRAFSLWASHPSSR